jgi:putative transposase
VTRLRVAFRSLRKVGHSRCDRAGQSATVLSQTVCFQVSGTLPEVPAAEGGVFKGRHFDRSVILLCVRWYLAYNLSPRNLEEMMAERGISVDHATIHRWVVRCSPELLERFNFRKRSVSRKWHVDETYIKVRGQWKYLYRAIDSNGDTIEFWFSERRNLTAAKRFLARALKRHGRPERIVIDGSQTNRKAILSCDTTDRLRNTSRRKLKPIRIRQSQYLNNLIEQDHRAIKRRVRPMLGFKSIDSARAILSGIEMVHMMRKQQAKYACNPQPSLAEQFDLLAA